MGTDTEGKQEVDPRILAQATVFIDEIAQSINIGKAQHAVAAEILFAEQITLMREVINNSLPDRQSEQENHSIRWHQGKTSRPSGCLSSRESCRSAWAC